MHGNVHCMDSLKLDKPHLLTILQGKTCTSLNSLRVEDYFFSGVLWCCVCGNKFFLWIGRKLILHILIAAETYEPVHAKWTTERCAICRWVEDWDDNKIIICNRYFHHL